MKTTTDLFSFYRAPVSNTMVYRNVSLSDVAKYISGDYALQQTETLRQMIADHRSDDDIKRFKSNNFCYCTFSAVFPDRQRRAAAAISHSNLICLDIDNLSRNQVEPLFADLSADETLAPLLMFRSPSGLGIKLVSEIDVSRNSHFEWFQAFETYIRSTYAIDIDRACKDISRACFLPSDKRLFLNF